MVGTRGKGKASAAKSKGKAPSVVSAVPEPEPVVAGESSECPSDGENKIEIPSTDEKENDDKKIAIPSTYEKENDDTTSGLVVGNGSEDNQQLADEGNDDEKSNVEKNDFENNDSEKSDDEKDVTDELITNEVDSLSEDLDELCPDDDDHAASDVNSENDGVDIEEENVEDLSDDGGAVNNADGEDNEGKPDEEVEMEDKEPTNDCSGNEKIHTGEENKDTEVAEDGKMVTGEGLAASEHGLSDEMTSKEASDELNAKEPLPTSVESKETAEERENVSIANNVKASTEETKKPKRKIIKYKLIKKVRKNDVASNNEAKPQSAIVNDASGNGERNEEKAEIKRPVNVKKKLIRKRKSVVSESNAAGVAASSDVQKAEPTNIEQGTEVMNETDKLDVEGEKAEKLVNKASRLKKKRKQKVKKDEATGNVVTGDANKPGPSQKGKSKKFDAMGMIFMCSSETKKDCYHYKVLGLPAGKKDFVSNIYKGMRLFLFDVELRMLYGIYKAATPGGFNIEPKAFKSKFPSQVRFTVLEECVPLAEETFKRVIKKNYYSKNKFNCKLTGVQVKKLCKLFRETTKKANSTRIVRNPVEAAPSSAQWDKKRKRKGTEKGYKAGPASSSKRERRLPEREVRRGPVAVAADDRYYQRPVVYEREAYLPPPAPPVQMVYQALPPPSRPQPSSYSYGGPTREDIYGREPALDPVPVMERRELGLSSLRHPDRCEPYASYRESRGAYLEPAYETGIRRDLYEASTRRDLYEASTRRDLYEPLSARREHYEYTSDARRVEYYSAPEYRPPLPPYRRY